MSILAPLGSQNSGRFVGERIFSPWSQLRSYPVGVRFACLVVVGISELGRLVGTGSSLAGQVGLPMLVHPQQPFLFALAVGTRSIPQHSPAPTSKAGNQRFIWGAPALIWHPGAWRLQRDMSPGLSLQALERQTHNCSARCLTLPLLIIIRRPGLHCPDGEAAAIFPTEKSRAPL